MKRRKEERRMEKRRQGDEEGGGEEEEGKRRKKVEVRLVRVGKDDIEDAEEREWGEECVYAMENGEAWDDLTREWMDPEEVRAARAEEMEYVKGIPVYEEREVDECWRETGRGPTSTKWVDIKKEGGVRSRWVARGVGRTSSPRCPHWRRRNSYSL